MTRLSGERRSGIRTRLAAGMALLALATTAVAGCSSSDEAEDDPIEGANSESPEPSESSPSGDTADVAALEQLYADYWDAMVELENSEELNSQLLVGIATSHVVEVELSRIDTYKSQGFFREGEPTIENVTVQTNGDTARIEACKNEGDWPFVTADGQEVDDPAFADLGVTEPNVLEAERSADGWLISGSLPIAQAEISC